MRHGDPFPLHLCLGAPKRRRLGALGRFDRLYIRAAVCPCRANHGPRKPHARTLCADTCRAIGTNAEQLNPRIATLALALCGWLAPLLYRPKSSHFWTSRDAGAVRSPARPAPRSRPSRPAGMSAKIFTAMDTSWFSLMRGWSESGNSACRWVRVCLCLVPKA